MALLQQQLLQQQQQKLHITASLGLVAYHNVRKIVYLFVVGQIRRVISPLSCYYSNKYILQYAPKIEHKAT